MKKNLKKVILIISILTLLFSCEEKKDYGNMSSEEVMIEVEQLRSVALKEKNSKKRKKILKKEKILTSLARDKTTVEIGVEHAPEKVKVIYKTPEQISKMTEEELNKENDMMRSKLWYETENINEKDEEYFELLKQSYLKIYNDRIYNGQNN